MKLYQKLIARGLKGLGLFELYKRYHRRDLLIITYHGILPDHACRSDSISPERQFEFRNFVCASAFDEQVRNLKKKFNPITLKEYLFRRAKNQTLPDYSVVITFDDGFKNNYEYAFPILQKWGVSAVFYISTNFIGKSEMLWTEEIIYRINHTHKPLLKVWLNDAESIFYLKSAQERENASNWLRGRLKHSRKPAVLKILQQIREQLDDVSLELDELDKLRYQFMTWEDVNEMLAGGMEIGSHTHNHFILSQLDEAECRDELRRSKELIEKNTGQECLLFSYPNGRQTDFSARDKKILKELGYACATTQIGHMNNYNTDLFELGRLNISRQAIGIAFDTMVSSPLGKIRQNQSPGAIIE